MQNKILKIVYGGIMKKAPLAEGLVLLSLVSCGGSNSSSGGSSSIESQFIDAPVKGLNIERTVSGNGSTGDLGKFSCVANEVVTFKLRNLTLGSAVCGAKIYLDDVASGAKRNNIAAVLQNLSTTAASGGVIDLSSVPAAQDLSAIAAVITVTGASGALMTAVSTARSAVEAAAGVTLTPAITQAAAIAHANVRLGFRAHKPKSFKL